jgi:hypothetical protein
MPIRRPKPLPDASITDRGKEIIRREPVKGKIRDVEDH